MSNVGNIWVTTRLRDQATSQFKKSLGIMKNSALKFAAGFGAFSFIREGIKQQSDFVENWSVVTNSAGQQVQDAFTNAFAQLRRTSKAEASNLAATIVGTMKSKGIDDSVIAALGPQIIQRLEDTGAFYNKTTEDVLHAFTSMISGMARPMEMLTKGAVVPLVANLDRLSQSQFGMNFEKLAPDQQTLLRMKFFLEGTAKVPFLVGNSAATIGTFKGQLDSMKASVKDSSASIAQNLMPTIAKLMKMMAQLAEWIDKNKTLIFALAGAFAGFKVVKFVMAMGKAVMALYAFAVAKAGAQGGIAGVVTAGAVALGLGAILGGIAGGMFFAGGGSKGVNSNGQATGTTVINITTVDKNLRVNGQGTNLGRGGE